MEAWTAAFRERGRVPHQSPHQVAARLDDPACPVSVVYAGGAFSAFVRRGPAAVCLLQGAGLLPAGVASPDARELLTAARSATGAEVLYLPLLYTDLPTTGSLREVPGAAVLERRPSPVIAWEERGADLWARCRSRLGSRARRRLRKFEAADLRIADLQGDEAVKAIAAVERLSWKARLGQDMHSRGQMEHYRHLLLAGDVHTRAVLSDAGPVAYRLDAIVADTLFCLKWSFDESFRHLSPGFVMIAHDLVEQYGERALRQIDLFGSPDHLKDSVSTGGRTRIDIAWPDGPRSREFLRERAEHDRRSAAVYRGGRGIRTAYEGSHGGSGG